MSGCGIAAVANGLKVGGRSRTAEKNMEKKIPDRLARGGKA